LEVVILSIGKEIVLEALSLSISKTIEGKTERKKPSIPKASDRGVVFDAHVGKGKSF
jgi:hypothetical protein